MHIVCLNCRGLNYKIKRSLFFKEFYNYHIICLQETYINEKNHLEWKQEWKGDFVYVCGTPHSQGLIILINTKKFKPVNIKQININERVFGISFDLDNKQFIIFNVYAPAIKDERIPFITELSNLLSGHMQQNVYAAICGDWNMLLDTHLDDISGVPHPKKEIHAFNNFVKKLELIDVWRKLNPNSKDFSWIRYNNSTAIHNETTFTARRLDYVFITMNMVQFLKFSNMKMISSTDHKQVIATFNFEDFLRGPGRWALNESLLDNDIFVESMNVFINVHYNELKRENIYDDCMLWDLLKVGIMDNCVLFSKQKKIEDFNTCNIDFQIKEINEFLIANPSDKRFINELFKLTSTKEIRELAEARGALKRSKVKVIQESEKNTKYFLGMEASIQSKKIVREVYNQDMVVINDPSKITIELKKFYSELLSAPEVDENYDSSLFIHAFLGEEEHPILTNEEKIDLDTPLSLLELERSLKSLNKESAPGSDGLSPLFYLKFWDSLKTPLFKSINRSLDQKLLSLSQRRAILTLLPKSNDMDLKHISAWRPISLTNTDYKIISKAFAMRMQSVIGKLINENQVGYVKGRNINDHIRFIDDVISYVNSNDLSGLLVSLDYKKAFDSISKSSILTSLKKFNFGTYFIKIVETILNGTEASVKNAGWLSEWFSTTRGVRQGCSLSPLLFILVVELLAIKIRNDNNIKGILDHTNTAFQSETKLIMYADDMSLILKNNNCLAKALKIIEEFSTFSGLLLNRNKSLGMWLGNNVDQEVETENLKWLEDKDNMKILGVYFNRKSEASLLRDNWDKRKEEIEQSISSWNKRNPSLIGKVLVAKTFLLSKMNFAIQSLNASPEFLDTIDKLIFKFLWKSNTNVNGREKIKKKVLCKDYAEGGLKMIQICDQQKVMLMKWLFKLCSNKDSTHFKLVNEIFKHVGGIEYILHCNAQKIDFKGISQIKSVYWQAVLNTWIDIKDKTLFYDNHQQERIPIFNNSKITFKGKTLFIKLWIQKGFKYVDQFIVNNNFLSFHEIVAEIGGHGGSSF